MVAWCGWVASASVSRIVLLRCIMHAVFGRLSENRVLQVSTRPSSQVRRQPPQGEGSSQAMASPHHGAAPGHGIGPGHGTAAGHWDAAEFGPFQAMPSANRRSRRGVATSIVATPGHRSALGHGIAAGHQEAAGDWDSADMGPPQAMPPPGHERFAKGRR